MKLCHLPQLVHCDSLPYLVTARPGHLSHLLLLGPGGEAVGWGVLDGRHSVGIGRRAGLAGGARPGLGLHAEGVAGGRLPGLLLRRARVVAVGGGSGELLQVPQLDVEGGGGGLALTWHHLNITYWAMVLPLVVRPVVL